MRIWIIALFALIGSALQGAEVKPVYKLNRDELAARLESDARAIQVQRDGLRRVIEFMGTRDDLFPAARQRESGLLRRGEKAVVWSTWQRFLDHMVALESLDRYHARFYRLKGAAREESFLIGYAAMLAGYRAALEFITLAEHNPELDKVLNDPVPELGLPGGTYAKLKFNYLNVGMATDFAAREVLLKTFQNGRQAALRKAIDADSEYVWKAGRGRGEMLTARNALKVVRNGAQSAWLPVQAGVAEWMGDTKVYRPERSLISQKQIRELLPKLQPGDILLERREWYLSNIGLPGYWPHAALYIGTPEERRNYFDEPEVRAWVRKYGEPSGNLNDLLQGRHPDACKLSQQTQEEGHRVRLLEAISEGVSFTTLEHSADCDSLAVLRPRLSKAGKALALLRAFHYSGRPYDFNFDFSTDAELVCTELVYKSYEPSSGFTGLVFPLVEMLGRKVTPANEIARQFDEQFGTPDQQFDLVMFIDGSERRRSAMVATVEDFRQSWRRPKWHVLVQE